MKRLTSAALVLALLSPAGADEKDRENPFKKAKVGEWVEYKTSTAVGDNKAEGTARVFVAAKNDKEALLRSVGRVGGKEVAAPDQKIDLSKPFDPFAAVNLPKGADVRITKAGEGKEKVKAGGKEYDCVWQKVTILGRAEGADFNGEATIWTSADAPLTGMVKMEMSGKVALNTPFKMTMELMDSGGK